MTEGQAGDRLTTQGAPLRDADRSVTASGASFWIDRDDAGPITDGAVMPDEKVDVVIVGAGIVGATAALELAEAGASVVVLEAADLPARGVTGHATAKVTSAHGLAVDRIDRDHGRGVAVEYASASMRGQEHVRSRAATLAPGSWTASPHDLIATETGAARRLERHAVLAQEVGLTTQERAGTDLATAGRVLAAVRYPDQAMLDPVAYVRGLVSGAAARGARFRWGVTAHDVAEGSPCRVLTSAGPIRGDHVLIASHLPFLDRSLAFAVSEQRRHYAVFGEVPEGVGMSLDVGSGLSLRDIVENGENNRAIAVTDGHAVGQSRPTRHRRSLHQTAHGRLGMRIEGSWSSQDVFTTDGLPLCGPGGLRGGLWIASGFAAWGLTLGTAAALDIAGRIQGRPSVVPSWNPRRAGLLRHPRTSLTVTGRTVRNLTRSLVPQSTEPVDKALRDLAPGQGRVVGGPVHPVGVCRDREGNPHTVSARCTHLGCVVSWNDEAESWDCPCHGSRFRADGSLVHGPATEPLPRHGPDTGP